MFFKRLSTALCVLVCTGGFVLGSNPVTVSNANNNEELSAHAAPLALGVNIKAIDISCFNENDGKIEITVTDYQLPITWRLFKENGTFVKQNTENINPPYTITVPSKGKFYVTVTDGSGISVPAQSNLVEVVEPNPIEVSLVSIDDIKCYNGVGSIYLLASGDFPVNQYFVRNTDTGNTTPSSTGQFSNLTAGNYQAWALDVNNCRGDYNGATVLKLNNPAAINFTYNIVSQITCSNGFASVDFNNLPTDPFTIDVRNTTLTKTYTAHDANYVFSNLDAGNYTVTVTRNSCSTDFQTQNFTIDAYNAVTLGTNPASPVDLLCGGNADLTNVTVTASGGKAGRQVRIVFDNNNGLNDDQQATILFGETATFTNLSAGNYTIRWIDVLNPSCTGSQSFVINAPASPLEFTRVPAQKTPSCYGENNGTIDFSVTGGVGSYTYIVNGISYTNPNNIILAPGNYSMYVQDQNGCPTAPESFTIDQTPQLTLSLLSAQTEQLNCINGNNGRISVEANSGSGNYLYTMLKDGASTPINNTPGIAQNNFSNLGAGVYNISVSDGVCAAAPTVQETIFPLNPITIGYAIEPLTVKCKDEPTTIWISANGAVGKKFTYSLYKNGVFVESKIENNYNDGVPFTNLPPANYTVWVKYDDACDSVSQAINIYNPREFKVTYPSTIQLNCFGETATASISATGEYPFEYSLDNGNTFIPFNIGMGTSVQISNLPRGDNNILFRDRLGCVFNNGTPVTIVVNEPDDMNIQVMTTNPKVGCTGGEAEVTLQISGGSAPFSVEVLGIGKAPKSTDNNGMVTFNIPAGNDYDVKVTDIDQNCEKDFVNLFSVATPAVPFAIASINIDQQALSCFGDSTRVEVQLEGGWGGNYVINVIGSTINKNLPASGVIYLKAGTYNFQATDLTYGCKTTVETRVISQPNRLVMNIVNQKNVSCFGADDAEIAIGVSGGTQPYFWGVNDAPTHQFTGNSYAITSADIPLGQGTYNVQVADANGCKSPIRVVNISEPAPITFEYQVDSVSCYNGNNGAIRIYNVAGGSRSGYRSYISTGGAFVAGTLTINGLTQNNYQVYVADNSGACVSETKTIAVAQPDEIIITAIEKDDIQCYGVFAGRIKITATGGAPYGLQYRITRGTTYDSGYNNSNEFTNLEPGVYRAWVRNTKGSCAQQYPTDIVINNVAELIVNTPAVTDVSCNNLHDGSVRITASGGSGVLTYTLTNTSPVISNTNGIFNDLGEDNKASTTYQYTVEDANQCSKSGSFIVRNPPVLKLEFRSKTDVVCHNDNNGTILVRATGGTVSTGYSFYDKNNGGLTYQVTPVSAGDYRITGLGTTSAITNYLPVVVDNNKCEAELNMGEVEIINPEQVVINQVIPGIKLCHGDLDDSTVVYASGGSGKFYYSLDNGTNFGALTDSVFIGEATGTKQPMVKDENNCVASAPMYEYVEPDALKAFYKFSPILCYDDEYANMELKIMGGTGNYALGINDPNFAGDVSFITRVKNDTTNYNLLDNNVFLIENTRYRFYVRDENNCHVENISGVNSYSKPIADTIFTKPSKLVLIADSLTMKPVTCSADQTGIIRFAAQGGTVTASKGYSLRAVHVAMNYSSVNKPFSNYVENLFAGLHHVYLTDANGCVGETRLTDDGFTHDTITVGYANISLRVNVSNIDLPNCDDTHDGKLEIDLEDFNEEGVTAYVEKLDTTLGLFFDLENDEDDYIESNPAFVGTSGLYFLNNIQIAQGFGVGTYKITVRDNYTNCVSYIDTTVFSVNGDSCPPTFFYNVFTPHNNDDYNENWTIFGSEYQKYTLQIYTSLGELIYTDKGIADSQGVKWNGVDNKKRPVPVGTYIYLLRKNEGTPRDTLINGNVTIIRGDGRW